MPITVTPIYAIILMAIYVVLFMRVVIERRTNRFAYGDNNSPRVHAKIRASANWAEHVPMTLLLFLIAELQSAPIMLLHTIGLLLVIARGVHGYSMSFAPKTIQLRMFGMTLHVIVMIILMVTVIIMSAVHAGVLQ